MITVEWRGRFGNQLFQYCFGRILALETGRAVRFPPSFYTDRDHLHPHAELWRPISQSGDVEGCRGTATLVQGHAFDRGLLQQGRPLVLRGWFQRYEYYKAYKEVIRRDWLALPRSPRPDVHPDDVYVHVRRTDYAAEYPFAVFATPWHHFDRAIERLGAWRRLVVVTDDPHDAFHDSFRRRYDAVVQHNTLTEDFLALAGARRAVISQSSFAWWATFLGHGEHVICPIGKNSVWNRDAASVQEHDPTRFSSIQIDDEPRFEYLAFN